MSMRGYEGNLIKAEIQKVLRDIPMTPSEIGLRFKLDKRTVSSFLTTLKEYGLISWHPKFCTGHVVYRKYYAHADGENFMDIVHSLAQTKQERIAEKRKAKEEEVQQAKLNPNIRIYTMDDEIFKNARNKTPKPRYKTEWRGYDSMAGI